MAKIDEVAPVLALAGITCEQLTTDLSPAEPAKPAGPPGLDPKRYRMAYRYAKEGLSDADVMRLACVSQSVVDVVRWEMRAATAVLAKGETIEAAAVKAETPFPNPGEPGEVGP